MKLSRLALLSVFALASAPSWAESVVTVYSIDGLHDGDNSWYRCSLTRSPKRPALPYAMLKAVVAW